jgi:hypothetical protein
MLEDLERKAGERSGRIWGVNEGGIQPRLGQAREPNVEN